MKEDRVSIRLDVNTSLEIKELSKHHSVSLSTMIRTLLKRSLNEIRDRTAGASDTKKV